MSPSALLPDLPGFCVEQISRTENDFVITARVTSPMLNDDSKYLWKTKVK